MIKNVLEHIGGVGVYGVLSISIFFAFFTGMLWWAGRAKKSHLEAMSALPLEENGRPHSIETRNES
jgi:hypothetical protein